MKVLKNYPIFLVCPTQLSVASYLADAQQHGVNCQASTFASYFFADIDGYNRLMLSQQFYARFQAYEYLLLYQLDAFVFRDDLLAWCTRGYSYIGAPWFEGYVPGNDSAKLWAVGNGGFTLRRVADCLRVLSTFAVARPWAAVIKEHSPSRSPGFLRQAYLAARYLLIGNNTHWLFNDFYRYRQSHQEDYFWGVVCPAIFLWYKVPTPHKALAFAFEAEPSRMYTLNHQQLPMGCHAWEKYEPQFWAPFIIYAANTTS